MTLSPRVRRLSWGEAKDVSRRHFSISCSKVMYKASYSRVWCRAPRSETQQPVEDPMARKYGKKSQKTVKSAMHKYKHGKLKSGKSKKKVKNPKQAIAIGLSEARKKGAKVPRKKKK